MRAADKAGLELSIHALGDRGIDTVTEQMKAMRARTFEAAVTSLNIFSTRRKRPSKSWRTQEYASMQPYHAIDDGRWAEDRIGAEHLKTTYAFRSILDAGAF